MLAGRMPCAGTRTVKELAVPKLEAIVWLGLKAKTPTPLLGRQHNCFGLFFAFTHPQDIEKVFIHPTPLAYVLAL